MNLYKYYSNPEELNGYKDRLFIVPQLAYKKLGCGIADTELKHKCEMCISKSPTYSYQYAKFIHCGKFPMGEPTIATDIYYAYHYAKDVLNGPFSIGEKLIASDPQYACRYAVYVLHGRFELAEPTILNSEHKNRYLMFLKSEGINI